MFFVKHYRQLLAVALISVALGGCAQWQAFTQDVRNAVSFATSVSVTPQEAYVAINVYDGAEATATNLVPKMSSAVRQQVKKLVLAGRVARNEVKGYLRAHPGANLAIQSFTDLKNATSGLQSIIDAYKTN
jgi:hypothetical protein